MDDDEDDEDNDDDDAKDVIDLVDAVDEVEETEPDLLAVGDEVEAASSKAHPSGLDATSGFASSSIKFRWTCKTRSRKRAREEEEAEEESCESGSSG